MKKMKKLSAAVALALSMGVISQAHAAITLKPNGKGDALLFPVYNSYVENTFTISNNENKWIQGHIRFRGAAWSGELLDFDVILSPGDVFVFRLADVDGDGQWEIDQSLDPKNFMYTGQVSKCIDSRDADKKTDLCMDYSTLLVPTIRNTAITQPIVEHHLHTGYIEFVGEAVLDGMDAKTMMSLMSTKPTDDLVKYQTRVGSGTGVSAWSWSQAAKRFDGDKGLSDVPNALTGTAFISLPGSFDGLAYNAEALQNFRTDMTEHRIDNYRMYHDPKIGKYDSLDKDDEAKVKKNQAVILHDEDVAGKGIADPYLPYGDYVFRFESFGKIPGTQEDRQDESRMSFQNTWGPTLADGDDYLLAGIRPTYDDPEDDDFDASWTKNPYGFGVPNSIAEVEEAIREDGQSYTSFYNDEWMEQGGEGSQYFVYFPTKVYWSELYNQYEATSLSQYIQQSVQWLLSKSKKYRLELWDTEEREACQRKPEIAGTTSPYQPGVGGGLGGCGTTSPSTGCETPTPTVVTALCQTDLGFELNFFNITDVKTRFPKKEESGMDVFSQEFKGGRVVFEPEADYDDPFMNQLRQSWPALMYTFELAQNFRQEWLLTGWRSMQRGPKVRLQK